MDLLVFVRRLYRNESAENWRYMSTRWLGLSGKNQHEPTKEWLRFASAGPLTAHAHNLCGFIRHRRSVRADTNEQTPHGITLSMQAGAALASGVSQQAL